MNTVTTKIITPNPESKRDYTKKDRSPHEPITAISYYALHGKLDEIKSELQEAIFKKLDDLAKEIKKPLKEDLNKKFEILEKNNTTYLAGLKDALNKKLFEDIYKDCIHRALRGKLDQKDFNKLDHEERHEPYVDYYAEKEESE